MNKRVKVVFAGQSGVGKSSIIHRFDHEEICKLYSTVGAAFISKKIKHNDDI
jgi:GTPase SAR1 family protein